MDVHRDSPTSIDTPQTATPIRPATPVGSAHAWVFDRAPVGLAVIDAEGTLVEANASLLAMCGRRRDEVIGHRLSSILDPVQHEAAWRWFNRCLEGGEITLHAETWLRPAGVAPIWASIHVDLLPSNDEGPGNVVVAVSDISDQRDLHGALEAVRGDLTSIFELSPIGMVRVDEDGRVVGWNPSVAQLLGWAESEVVGGVTPIIPEDDVALHRAFLERALAGERIDGEHATLVAKDGSRVEVHAWARVVGNEGEHPEVIVMVVDVTRQAEAERLVTSQAAILELIARDAKLDDVLNTIAAMVEDHDEGGQATVVLIEDDRLRPRARADRGPSSEVRAALNQLVVPPEAQAALRGEHGEPIVIQDVRNDPRTSSLAPVLEADGLRSLWWASAAARGRTDARGGVVIFHRDDHTPSNHALRAAEIACTLIAVALERHSTVAALAHTELHDGLTGLPNRTLLIDRLETGLDRARRAGDEVSLLYIDLDRFKRINDSEGLAAGDEVLTIVARRLEGVTRPGDTVARVGADEFVILSDQAGNLSTMVAVADRLTAAMLDPVTVGDHDVFVTASMGLAVSTEGVDGTELLRRADAAMDRAKERGRNRLEVYDPAMQASASDRLILGSDLRRALGRDELRVVYQPIVDLSSGTMGGAEALIRWHHPTRGDVPPSVFIPVAEESGTITEIGMWVLETALGELAPHLASRRSQPFSLSVNLSPRQLDDPDLVPRVQAALSRHDWPADRLCLELTETALTDDLDLALDVLVRLRATGIRIAVDDFGTGYSSLTHLQRLPIDAIKVDRSFVQSLGERGGSERSTIARCVLGIAATMGLEAVAEGVETPDQLDALRRLGCLRGQGYLFSVPVPVQALLSTVSSR